MNRDKLKSKKKSLLLDDGNWLVSIQGERTRAWRVKDDGSIIEIGSYTDIVEVFKLLNELADDKIKELEEWKRNQKLK